MQPHDPRRIYRRQQLDGAGPAGLVIAVYRHAIRACQTGRRGVVVRALEELIGGLDLERGDLAVHLLRMYEYLLYRAREGRLEEVEGHLRELLMAWEESARSSPGPTLLSAE